MQVPLQVTFRDVEKTPELEGLIEAQAARLERVCNHATSCRVAVEAPHRDQVGDKQHRVRVEVRVPPGHDVVVDQETSDTDGPQPLEGLVRDAFQGARRRLEKLVAQQRGEVKHHPAQQVTGVIAKLFDGYGFLKTVDGREVYFHAHSVIDDDFTDLAVGMGVAYLEEPGEEGPQASTVRVMDRRARSEGHDSAPNL